MNNTHKVILGKFASVYGVKGWIKVVSYTDPIENILNYPVWQVKHAGNWQSITIEQGKRHDKFIVVKIKGDDDRDIVRRFTNDVIAVAREQLPKLEEDEHYIEDLIGLNIETTDGTSLGRIIEIQATGANDIIVTENATKQQHLIPYLDHVVKQIDTEKRLMIVDWDTSWETDK
ncbi:MAG: ribosome maturation factor RimM [Gammaproteobacteria bacterium]|nr:ribosome maturation factor RimM [Gammaproteobacteria bacterium]MCH9744232.1 ribosome maturation factor RimM [Gammaproteobacteria bacterium]